MNPQTKMAASSSRWYWLVMVLLVSGIVGVHAPSAASAPTTDQATFASPAEAGTALRNAAQKGDESALSSILGPESKAIMSSGDLKEDAAALQEFVSKYDEMNRWVLMTDGTEILKIGADNYPFPIPLRQNSSSRWFFDARGGADEILARRIGRNELLAIDAICAIAYAEDIYAQTSHDGNSAGLYTAKILSTPEKQDGLYWKVPEDKELSPLGRVNEFAPDALPTPNEAPIIDGYTFRILTARGYAAEGGAKSYIINGKLIGGFAVIASPVKYGQSGIMTFIINQEGDVYQQDLGEQTSKVAAAIHQYNPTAEWEVVE
jgi:Protein of unknown function (DUF2950)